MDEACKVTIGEYNSTLVMNLERRNSCRETGTEGRTLDERISL